MGAPDPAPPERLAIRVEGTVQGVGFRPFVHRAARALGLVGWVRNDGGGVSIEAEGPPARLVNLLDRIRADPPPRAVVESVRTHRLPPRGDATFEIRASGGGERPTAPVLADGATCAACLAEVLDPADRRHGYPFANCTACGPRFTIVTSLPYDRPNTTMRGFAMCDACRREYEDPADRRFHAQPIACPACGPHVEFWSAAGEALARRAEALAMAAEALAAGHVVAAKGVGGFHLLADATRPEVVARLRRRKDREEKPLAILVRDLAAAREACEVSPAAARLLCSPEAPIVLLPRRADARISPSVAPRNPRLGVMLPYAPLHHLLLRAVPFPLVATSGNRTDEPICTDEREAVERLRGIADYFLVHDRPIARHVDDSVVLVEGAEVHPIRRARGYAPMPVGLPRPVPAILAVGGHLKNVVAVAIGDRAHLSQHIGDLETPQAREAFERVIADLLAMYRIEPAIIAHDLHPEYASTRWALDAGRDPDGPEWLRPLAGATRVAVQHHHAHLAACLAEHGDPGPALGVVWDGTGLGPDRAIWGGEFLRGDAAAFERVAHLRPFLLPGGDQAAREPRRSALAALHELRGAAAFDALPRDAFAPEERAPLERMLATGLRSPPTTSAGRLFDAVAALLRLRSRASFEGQAPMELEHVADPRTRSAYDLPLVPGDGGPARLDWGPCLEAVVADRDRGVPLPKISARFHNALAAGILRVAQAVGERRVVLSGGCFQNQRLLARTRDLLRGAGFDVLIHRIVPPNDGGLCLGQIAVAAAREGAQPLAG